VDEVLKLRGVTDEEHRSVVAHHVEVPLVGAEFEGKATGVTDSVGKALFASHCREAGEHRGALADLGQEARPGEPGDILGDLEEPVSTAALGMDDPLGHSLPVEMLHLLDDIVVVQRGRSTGADRQ
jgi:hypothetical protein